MENILSFKQFLNKYFDWFKVDQQAEKFIEAASLWSWRDPAFEKLKSGYYLEKGFLVTGNVGTGKTEAVRLLKKYLIYIRSPYQFNSAITWLFADSFREQGISALARVKDGNWFFDELGLTDEKTGDLTKETVNSYGNKVVIGKELIMKRSNIFKATGYQTHFTTNLSPKQLKEAYGERCYSRLLEMCNFIDYTGKDRRIGSRPTFASNKNEYKPESAALPTKEQENDVIQWLNDIYENYLKTRDEKSIYSGFFEMYKNKGIEVSSDENLRVLALEVETERLEAIKKSKISGSLSLQDSKRMKELLKQYENKNLDREELSVVWTEAKKRALIKYFEICASRNIKQIFLNEN